MRIDLTGKRFGRLVVISFSHLNKRNQSHFLCRCDCGSKSIVQGWCLTSGHTTSCGCFRIQRVSESLRSDVIGRTFSRLTVIKLDSTRNKRLYYLCRCSCGTEKAILIENVKSGKIKSCGCLQKDFMRTHGMSNSKVYRTWEAMIQRCTNPNNAKYRLYGGRGIRVFSNWRKSFSAFYSHIGEPPSSKHSIDRINSDKGYYPGNVRWSTIFEQNNNLRKNVLISFNGSRMTLTQWGRKLNCSSSVIRWRLQSWPIDEALTRPVKKQSR